VRRWPELAKRFAVEYLATLVRGVSLPEPPYSGVDPKGFCGAKRYP